MLSRRLKQFIQRNWLLRETHRLLRTRQVILLEFPVASRPRWGHGHPPHPELYEVLNRERGQFAEALRGFLALRDSFQPIEAHAPRDSAQPNWINGYLPRLDAVALYGLLVKHNPVRYVEIGSGHSTKFARRAIQDHGLQTSITSIDPAPRAQIDELADEVIRRPLEDLDLAPLRSLEAGDMLFYDGSHRCLMNSDVTVFFLEVLPRLNPGVLVHIHDITLPWDYPPGYVRRYYSEQYLLAAYLLAREAPFEIVLANAFICQDAELSAIMEPLWRMIQLDRPGGCSFWVRTTA
jgi:hypothetical protein